MDHGKEEEAERSSGKEKKATTTKETHVNMHIALKMGRLALELTKDPAPA